jgi:hypothetical protein
MYASVNINYTYTKLPSFEKSVTVFTACTPFLRKEVVGEFECEGCILHQ